MFAGALSGGIVAVVGPRYLSRLSVGEQIAIVALGVFIVATIALYGRRRARRKQAGDQ